LIQNESIQYNPNSGWQTYDDTGLLKVLGTSSNPPTLRIPPFYSTIASTTLVTSLTVTSGTNLAYYLGKADRAYTNMTIRYYIINCTWGYNNLRRISDLQRLPNNWICNNNKLQLQDVDLPTLVQYLMVQDIRILQ